MNSLPWLCSCVFALSLVPSFASADEPSTSEWALRRVEEGLMKPLSDLESHSFSRGRPPPHERRARVLESTATLDKNGRPFFSFAIDVRFGSSDWQENDIVGCAYTGTGHIFVKRGDAYRPVSFLFGKNEGPVSDVCVAAPPTPPRS